MKKGLIIRNNFTKTETMGRIVRLFQEAGARHGIRMDVKKTGELIHSPGVPNAPDCDFVLFLDKDVVLAELFEMAGYRVFNSSDAIERSDNKAYTCLELTKLGLPSPKTIIAPLTYEGLDYCNDNFVADAVEEIGFPMVVKELYGSFGRQVYLAENEEMLRALIKRLGYKGFLMQPLIRESYGKDIRVNVVGQKVVSAILRHNEQGDFRSNVANGASMEKIDLTKEQEELAIRASTGLSLDFSGVDILFSENGPIVCEVNSNPQFTGSIECTGIDVSEHIIRYIGETIL